MHTNSLQCIPGDIPSTEEIEEYQQVYRNLGFPELPPLIYVVGTIGKILEIMVERNKGEYSETTIFSAQKMPSISIVNYLERAFKYSECSMETYIFSLIYIDRFIDNCQNVILNELNVHK